MRQGWIGVEGGVVAYARQTSASCDFVRRLDGVEPRIAIPTLGWPVDGYGWFTMCASREEANAILAEARHRAQVRAIVVKRTRLANWAYDKLQEAEKALKAAERRIASLQKGVTARSAELEQARVMAEEAEAVLASDLTWTEKLKKLEEAKSDT